MMNSTSPSKRLRSTLTTRSSYFNYVPDFLIRLRDEASTGEDDLLTLILEVTGEAKYLTIIQNAYDYLQNTQCYATGGYGIGRDESLQHDDDDERGQGMVEYALILVLIAIVVIVVLQVVGQQVNNVFSNVNNGLAS